MCIFESKSEARYNICIVIGRDETLWKKFASMSFATKTLKEENALFDITEARLRPEKLVKGPTFTLPPIIPGSFHLQGPFTNLVFTSLIPRNNGW